MKLNGVTTQDIQELKPLLGRLLPQRFLTSRLLMFLRDSGVTGLLSSSKEVTLETVKILFDKKLGFDTSGHTRARMVQIIMDFLCECGFMERKAETYCWKETADDIGELSNEELEQARSFFGGQVMFFEKCIDYACEFLNGGPPLFRFDRKSLHVWASFLGNSEFEMARSLLVKLLSSGNADTCRLLNLCSGLGFDITSVQKVMPEAEITAIDFTDVFHERAYQTVQNPENIRWIDSSLWNGFGYPLPFNDRTFDIVFFACAAPYIPSGSRNYVYRDIYRVLKKSGSLGVLTNSYPDAEREFVRDTWIRRGVLCHDFAESVCEGWQGFSAPEDSLSIFTEAGFSVSSKLLNASIWRLEKP
jgi:SAM-dependent methyltransferase